MPGCRAVRHPVHCRLPSPSTASPGESRSFLGMFCRGTDSKFPQLPLGCSTFAFFGISHTINLGCSIALTGPLGQAGIEQVAGMKAAFAEVNAAGGVHGREIRMDPKDDGYVAARTLKNVTEMVEAQSVFALISPLGTANTASILPLIESKGIPTVGLVTGATSLRAPENRHVFFLRPTYREETQRLVKQIVDMGLKRIAVVYLDNPFGKEVLK